MSLEFFDDGVIGLGDVARVEKEVESDFHASGAAKLGTRGGIGKGRSATGGPSPIWRMLPTVENRF
jgi:hypothetical protein